MRRTTPLLLLAFVVTFGCGKNEEYVPKQTIEVAEAKVAPGDEASLAPLAVGNQWVYTVQSGSEKSEITLKVESVEQTPEGLEAFIGVYSNDSESNVATSTMIWRLNDTGLYQLTLGSDGVYDPPQLLLPFPLDKKTEYSNDGTGPRLIGEPGPYKTTTKMIGVQPVDTENSRMSGYTVQTVTTWDSNIGLAAANTFTWWSPGVGFIRQMQEIRTSEQTVKVLLKLKSHSFPRSSQ